MANLNYVLQERENVSFSYGEENVLDNISFKVERGEQVACYEVDG